MGKQQILSKAGMIARLRPGSILLGPLQIRSIQPAPRRGVDACLEATLPGNKFRWRFTLEAKTRSTPETVREAALQARRVVQVKEIPLVYVPYLSLEQLQFLEQEQLSGIDLCGNGIVQVQGRLYIYRTGNANQYPDSRPLKNPFQGLSSMVARLLVKRVAIESLTQLKRELEEAGITLSLGQTSKTIRALSEELVVAKQKGSITTINTARLLDELAKAYQPPKVTEKQAVRLFRSDDWPKLLNNQIEMKWAVTGASSAPHYVAFAQGGPRELYVSKLSHAVEALQATREPVPHFGDLLLLESEDEACYFQATPDSTGMRWASPLQTWLELQAGDARQRQAANDLKIQLLREVSHAG